MKQEANFMGKESNKSKSGAVLVVGGGIAGIQSSLDLADSGFKVYLLEETPAIGGTMAQLDKTFPTNDCAMCVMSPKLVECGRHLNINLITNAELLGIEGEAGKFSVKVKEKPRYVDAEKCTGCGACTQNCPVTKILYTDEEPEIFIEEKDLNIVDPILKKHRDQKGNLMPILQEIERAYNYLPKDVICYVGNKLEINSSNIYNIATFYNSFSLMPRGKHKISMCMGTTCYVRGGERIMDRLCDELEINPGETTRDLKFSLEPVRCLGCCSLAPAMMIDGKVYGRVKLSGISKILRSYQ
jgi:NADH:ubiquinone oxidoreductase subunit E/NAD-dependent dihydropyrimidine dehydrogenase PreA subunit